jgi:hypothetical protein
MIGMNEEGVPMVHLYRANNGQTVMINRELVDRSVNFCSTVYTYAVGPCLTILCMQARSTVDRGNHRSVAASLSGRASQLEQFRCVTKANSYSISEQLNVLYAQWFGCSRVLLWILICSQVLMRNTGSL